MNEKDDSESRDAKLARLQAERADRAAVAADLRKDREIERLELATRFEAEFGAEGSEFFIYDSGHATDPLFAVKRGASVQFTKYEDSKHTHADRYDFVAPCVIHPSIEAYREARERRIGVEVELANRLAKLFGLAVEVDRGK